MDKRLKEQKQINNFIINIYQHLQSKDNNLKILCFDCKESFCCKAKASIQIVGNEKQILKKIATQEHRNRAKIALTQKIMLGYYECPFLDLNGKCSIYEYRPIACSTYMVCSEPKGCENPHQKSAIIDPSFLVRYIKPKYLKKISSSSKGDILDVFE